MLKIIRRHRSSAAAHAAAVLAAGLLLVGCGGGDAEDTTAASSHAATAESMRAGGPADAGASPQAMLPAAADAREAAAANAPEDPPADPTDRRSERILALSAGALAQFDAVRLAQQATFGPTEALVAEIRRTGAPAWVAGQMALNVSRYTRGRGDTIHRDLSGVFFCDLPAYKGPDCWRDWFSTEPLLWDFYRNAMSQPDQLRQRVAWALQQIVVVNNLEVSGTYGFRNYNNMLLDQAFGTWRDLLRRVTLSPVMGDFLDHANNDPEAPNENYARELLQLFAIGTCRLNANGTLAGGRCEPTYDNDTVRHYAHALTGWTYPPGGRTAWGCWPEGLNCTYYGGDMVPADAFHDRAPRPLLAGVSLPAGLGAAAALEKVLDSLMAHPNMAPFVSRQLIQHLVTSNPRPAYVRRVAEAFAAGRYSRGGQQFGSGKRGDLAATVAAILLDDEARGENVRYMRSGRLREPVLYATGVLRAMNGRTDGAALGWWWGESLRQHVFRSPSVFNFYPPDYPVAGTSLVGPQFGIHNANSALERLNMLTWLFDWGGSGPDTSVPQALGTRVDVSAFAADAADAGRLVDRIALLAIGRPLAEPARSQVVQAVAWWTPAIDSRNWATRRAEQAAWLVFASPDYQVQR